MRLWNGWVNGAYSEQTTPKKMSICDLGDQWDQMRVYRKIAALLVQEIMRIDAVELEPLAVCNSRQTAGVWVCLQSAPGVEWVHQAPGLAELLESLLFVVVSF